MLENMTYSFINDDNIIGKWDYVNFIQTKEEFNPNSETIFSTLYLTSLDILPEGKMFIKIESQDPVESAFLWTWGYFYNSVDKVFNSYIIENIQDDDYLFFEWKSGDCLYRNMTPWYYVFKKRKEEII